LPAAMSDAWPLARAGFPVITLTAGSLSHAIRAIHTPRDRAEQLDPTALEREKDKRYATTIALRQALLGLRQSSGVGASPVGDLSKLMKRLFATRVKDKLEMLKRINLGASIADLDVTEVEDDAPKSEAPKSEAPKSEAPKNEAPAALGPPLPPVAAPVTVSPHKSNPPELVEYKEPSVIITSPGAATPALAAIEAATDAPFGFVEAPVEASSPRTPARSVVPFVLGAVLLLGLGGAALAVGLRRAKPEVTASSSSTKPVPVPTAPTAPTAPLPVVASASALPANDVPAPPASSATAAALPAPAEETELHIETVPARATIFIAGTKKGVSPLDLKLPKSREAITIEIRRAGFKTLKERVVPDVNQRLKLTLAVARDPGGTGSADYHKFE